MAGFVVGQGHREYDAQGLYAIRCQPGAAVKVGITRTPVRRFMQIRASNPTAEMVGFIPPCALDSYFGLTADELEYKLHTSLSDHSLGYEWFSDAPAVQFVRAQVEAFGTFYGEDGCLDLTAAEWEPLHLALEEIAEALKEFVRILPKGTCHPPLFAGWGSPC